MGVDKANGAGMRLARGLASLRADVSFAVIDAALVSVAYSLALMLRFLDQPDGVPARWWGDFSVALPVIVAVHIAANVIAGAYGHVWEFASIAEAVKIAVAGALATVFLLVAMLVYRVNSGELGPIPIGSLALGALIALSLMGVVRFRSRLFSFNRTEASHELATITRMLIVGTGKPAVDLARHLSQNGSAKVVGFVAESSMSEGRRLAGLSVLGFVNDLPAVIEKYGVDEVIVATRNGSPVVRSLVDICLSVDVRLRIVPDLDSVLGDAGRIQDVRDLEPDDLLVRESVRTDLESVGSMLADNVVLVTGAGGSIGAELVRQVLRFTPSRVLALDHDETHLHDALLGWRDLGIEVEPVLCDIRDRTRVLRVMDHYRPATVFHAAAHKHVPILEANPEEAVKTNILGTMILIEAAKRAGVERFVLISTDKAADPVGVMGASKRVAEMLIQAEAANGNSLQFSAVRFGNVLGSRGSVVPTFIDQINRGGPVTVTDPGMTRYFMTIREAVELVLQAAAIAHDGQVLVLDMGEPVRIVDLARRLIRMAGLVPGRDIEVRFTGRRPGERLHEMLSVVPLVPSAYPRISVADQGFPEPVTLLGAVTGLVKLASFEDRAHLRRALLALAKPDWNGETRPESLDFVIDLTKSDEVSAQSAALENAS
jgi:FlaA1/EpsC-like NDP-sugar epimerase